MALKKNKAKEGFNTDKTCLMVGYKIPGNINKVTKRIYMNQNDKSIRSALNILNIMEKEVGWKLTTITKLEDKSIYMVIGPREWNHMPQLASIYLLILRVSKAIDFTKAKTIMEIEKACAKYIVTTENKLSTRSNFDMLQVKKSYKHWITLLLNKDKVMGKRLMRTLYKNNVSTNGMDALMRNTADSTTLKNWNKVISSNA